MIRLITRGDDAGSCEGANLAIDQCVSAGTLKNVSVMVPGPSFEQAAQMLQRHLDIIDIGLHVTLNSEWDDFKWGPVSEAASSLQDEYGWFTRSPAVLHESGFVLEEALVEVRAQLSKARQAGLRLDYLDEHMGVGWLPGLSEGLRQLAESEGLMVLKGFAFLGHVPLSGLLSTLSALKEGTYVFVTHPGLDDATMAAFVHSGLEPGHVARERDAERKFLTSAEFEHALQEGWLEVCRFSESTA